jgi:hypothetical protein
MRCAETDDKGRFVLEDRLAEPCELFASAPGHTSRRQLCNPSTAGGAENTLVLEPAGAEVSGTVIDATGGTVPGGLVAVVERAGSAPSVTMTDANGRFVLPTSPGVVELVARSDGYSQAAQTVQAPAQGVRFVLAPGATIGGTVVEAHSGVALAGVVVVATAESGLGAAWSALSDSAGEFVLSALEGGVYQVTVRDDAFWTAPERVSVVIGQASAPIELRASAASRLRLTVLHEGGIACSDLSVFLSGDGAAIHEFSASGSVEFSGLASGVYDAEVQCAGALPKTERLELGAGGLDRQIFVSAGLVLSGSVESPSGARVLGAEVNVSPVGPPRRAAASCTTNERGKFSCSGLSEGEHVARVMVAGEPASEALSVTLGSSEAPAVVLKTFGLGTIRVSVFDDGASRPFRVFATSERGIPVEARPDAADFIFDKLPLGRYRPYIDSDDQDSRERTEVTLVREGQVERVTLSLPATQAIAGHVLDEQGAPVVDASVRVFPTDSNLSVPSNRSLAVTDERGQFTIGELPRGRYDIRVEASIGDGQARGISSGDRNVNVTVARHAHLSGSVREPSGARPTTFLIAYEREDGFYRQLPGQGGQWDLGLVQPGKYRVTASSLKARATREVQLRPGEAQELALELSEP